MQIIKNKKIFFGLLIIFLFFISCFLSFDSVQAQGFEKISASGYLDRIANKVGIKPDVTPEGKGTVVYIVGVIINGILGFLGILCLGIIIYAGLKWMMAGGNEESITTARQMIKYAVIGVAVVIGAYALSYYVVSNIISSAIRGGPNLELEGGLRGAACRSDSECPAGLQCINSRCTFTAMGACFVTSYPNVPPGIDLEDCFISSQAGCNISGYSWAEGAECP